MPCPYTYIAASGRLFSNTVPPRNLSVAYALLAALLPSKA